MCLCVCVRVHVCCVCVYVYVGVRWCRWCGLGRTHKVVKTKFLGNKLNVDMSHSLGHSDLTSLCFTFPFHDM